MRRLCQSREGFLLVSTMVVVMVIAMLAISTSQLIVVNHKVSLSSAYDTNAQLGADAAIDDAVQQIRSNASWTGSGGQTTLQDAANIRVTYESIVTSIDSSTKKVVGIGRTYYPSTKTSPIATRKYEALLKSSLPPAFGYSAIGGFGGLSMSGNSDIAGGDVYINGNISMIDNAQIGTPGAPLKVRAAHQVCPIPADSTYPRVCNPGENGEPIRLLSNAEIYGDVIANNQMTGTSMYSPGLIAGKVIPTTMPGHDRQAVKDAILTTMTGTQASCGGGDKTWPANLKIVGNVTISGVCNLTIEGNVWVTGNVRFIDLADVYVKNGLTKPPTIMIDGPGGLYNVGDIFPNASPNRLGLYIVTYWSAAACSPECLDVTGADLANSYDVVTITMDGNADAERTEIFSRWSAITMNSNANIGAMVGQKLNLGSNASLNFTMNVNYSSGGSGAWKIVSYKRVF